MSKAKINKDNLFAAPPAQAPRAGDLRAIEALGETKPERVYFTGAPRYARGLQELKNMSAESVALKDFITEAFDDLFEKYKGGEGRYKATDVAELRRRIENLPK